jgi:hypothetical protein
MLEWATQEPAGICIGTPHPIWSELRCTEKRKLENNICIFIKLAWSVIYVTVI